MPNRLAQETSPYLLQHQNNPVDWYPWGEEALTRSRTEEKPIFLSIGYSACHWCHVMEHESFESDSIAASLNSDFVCIKVDREERPDLDQVYMNAVQLMTGRGGWPMSVFLTPDLRPFYGGTYWPPTSRMGMPGFDRVIAAVADAWKNRREMALAQADELTSHMQSIGQHGEEGKPASGASADQLSLELLRSAVARMAKAFDPTHGGFGGAPKFPHSMDLQVLLRMYRRDPRPEILHMVTHTLDKMAQGGIYDHLAGGFARYSVDERWLVPHFEKMLYDNALLVAAYVETYQVTGEERFARVARETCDYVLRQMTDACGGFHSTEDADSEGEEGKFYVWTPEQVQQILGDDAQLFCELYDVTSSGNFEHHTSILNLSKSTAQFAALHGWDESALREWSSQCRAKLLTQRETRIPPGKDDKILVSWNALMIQALAMAGQVLNEPRYTAAAARAGKFLLTSLCREDGRLLHTYRLGSAKLDAYLDDYSYLINALVTLYEATQQESWIDTAMRLAETVLKHFQDAAGPGLFFTADDHEQLIARNKDVYDSSVPSGNAMAATALSRLGKLTGRTDLLAAGEGCLLAGLSIMQRSPTAAGQMLIALDLYLGPTQELVFLSDEANGATFGLLHEIQKKFLPGKVLAARIAGGPSDKSPHLSALFDQRSAGSNHVALYVCESYACQAPLTSSSDIQAALQKLA